MSLEHKKDRVAARKAAQEFLDRLFVLDDMFIEMADRRRKQDWDEVPGMNKQRGAVRRASQDLSAALVELRKYQ